MSYKHSSVHVATADLMVLFGLLYKNVKGIYFSQMGKYVGHYWILGSTTSSVCYIMFENQYRVYVSIIINLVPSWRIHNIGSFMSDITSNLKISNVFNNRSIRNLRVTGIMVMRRFTDVEADRPELFWKNLTSVLAWDPESDCLFVRFKGESRVRLA
ncbi:hypothetical protein [Gluconobacter sphaericus]|nr:hypothetical protein [Gluconobacter sphaericus]MBF0886120.1 hypothetical protein [Gluconobacter sphaericus]MBS1087249.1 hypothetical protein [Gluconobacter sphaericus]MBS1101289.1 hypothetical protein [Gluconobacter sphaericus]